MGHQFSRKQVNVRDLRAVADTPVKMCLTGNPAGIYFCEVNIGNKRKIYEKLIIKKERRH